MTPSSNEDIAPHGQKKPLNHTLTQGATQLDYKKKYGERIWAHDPLPLSDRIRHVIRNFPPELLPLVVVVTAGLGGATFAIIHKLWADPDLRRF
ncbi:hypothetical protein G9A89_010098 [Geosiphon pyriformis]|nr:hypothetical protein G9A89_010098 [Geosiphon pyriformis]